MTEKVSSTTTTLAKSKHSTVFGLVVRDQRSEIVELSLKSLEWLKKNDYKIIVEDITAGLLQIDPRRDNFTTLSDVELAVAADVVISLGGDGTLIGVARHAYGKSPVMLGVNFGTLGFLTEVSPHELIAVLEDFNQGRVNVAERLMIETTVYRDQKKIFNSQAVNDAVVHKGSKEGLVNLDLFFREEEIIRLRADGVIIATPTGSTAYSLAAGGSIVHPDLDCALVTPICPHSLTNRPFLLPLSDKIILQVPENQGVIYVTVDGQVSCELIQGDRVEIERSPNTVKFVRSPSRSYFKILQGKLNWGIPNSPD